MARVRVIYRESTCFETSNKNTTHNWWGKNSRYGVTRQHIAHAVADGRWSAGIQRDRSITATQSQSNWENLVATIYLSNCCASLIIPPYILTTQMRFSPQQLWSPAGALPLHFVHRNNEDALWKIKDSCSPRCFVLIKWNIIRHNGAPLTHTGAPSGPPHPPV
jgi:hypothetical protein